MAQLQFLPCLDSEEMAAARRSELYLGRDMAIYQSRITVKAVDSGYYENRAGEKVDWKQAIIDACLAKKTIPPWHDLSPNSHETFSRTRIQVSNETTFAAAVRLQNEGHIPLSLNFANGVTPGGGFLRGAIAQEESLCRISALFWTLLGDPMYLHHSYRDAPDSTDWAILSPRVPFFRSDSLEPFDEPLKLDFITCAAPFAPTIGKVTSAILLRHRILRLLTIARCSGYTSLVLGAWGCGAFGNDPHRTAEDFRSAIEKDFAGHFSTIVFAITDWSPERRFLAPFRAVFT
ncbi:MAG: TIGR02452 family protein [Planctomycetaceae bacterium]|nr:TIGR02452 family protein [Planctomycetaceae bacterium]